MQNYSYLRPSSRVLKNSTVNSNPTSPGQHQTFTNKHNTLTSQQQQSINRLREYIHRKNPQKQISNNILLRYCHLGKMSIIDTVQKFKYYDEWCEMEQISKDKQRGILHSGVFYCYGRDYQYSPNLYFNPNKLNVKDFTIEDYLVCLRTLLKPVEQYMLIQGKIDKWNVIVDIRSYNEISLKNNYSIFINNLLKICYAYPYRLKRLFIIIPGAYSGLWSKVTPHRNNTQLTEQVIKQLNLQKYCVKITNFKQFDKYIPVEERQKQYGGQLDDLAQFWPITSTNKLMEINSRFIQNSQLDSAQYNSIQNDANQSFFGQKEEKTSLCNLKQFCSIQ